MRMHWCLIALLIVCAAPAGAQVVENPANGHLYEMIHDINLADARALATDKGGYLMSISNQAEQDFIFASFEVTGIRIWIGLTDEAEEGTFVWMDGTPLTYENWADGEPNNFGGDESFVAMSGSGANQGLWTDFQGNQVNRAVIEIVQEFRWTQNTTGSSIAEEGEDLVFSVMADSPLAVDPITYQWFKDGAAIDGATSPTLAINDVTVADEGVYHAEAEDGLAKTTIVSNPLTLSVLPAGTLPAAGFLGLLLLGLGLAAGGAAALKRNIL